MAPEGLQRLRERVKPPAKAAARRVLPLIFRGDRVSCPCCGGRFRSFMRHAGRADSQCPRCLSLERHRVLWLFLVETGLLSGEPSILHFAPELALQENLRSLPGVYYVGADLSPNSTAELRADITDIPFDAGRFDYVICNHVLEHVPDDCRAMREIHRVLKPTGTAIMQHPVDAHREATFEDPSITSAQERLRLYGQRDHVRIYGRDFPDRLHQAGFTVEIRDFYGDLDGATVARHGLADEPIYLCTKAPVDRSAPLSPISQSVGRT